MILPLDLINVLLLSTRGTHYKQNKGSHTIKDDESSPRPATFVISDALSRCTLGILSFHHRGQSPMEDI